MVLYLNTSVLVKRYFREPYSDDVLSRWKSATQIVTSFIAYAETMASMYRKKRESVPLKERKSLEMLIIMVI